MHVGLACGTVESADLNLTDEVLAHRALFRSIVLIDSNNDIAKSPSLEIINIKSANHSTKRPNSSFDNLMMAALPFVQNRTGTIRGAN